MTYPLNTQGLLVDRYLQTNDNGVWDWTPNAWDLLCEAGALNPDGDLEADLEDNGGEPDGNAWMILLDGVHAAPEYEAIRNALDCPEVSVVVVDAGDAYDTLCDALTQYSQRETIYWMGFNKNDHLCIAT